ncbi:hypothetical protein ACH4MA_23735 [Streptomyces roseolus]
MTQADRFLAFLGLAAAICRDERLVRLTTEDTVEGRLRRGGTCRYTA